MILTKQHREAYEALINDGLTLAEEHLRKHGRFQRIALAISCDGRSARMIDRATLQEKAKLGEITAYAVLEDTEETHPESAEILRIISIRLDSAEGCPLEALVPYKITSSRNVYFGQLYLRHHEKSGAALSYKLSEIRVQTDK